MQETNNSFKYLLKRFSAYFLDLMLVFVLASAISNISWINPFYKEYSEKSIEYTNFINNYYKMTISLNQKYEDKIISEDEYQYLIEDNKEFGYLLTEKYEDGVITEEEYNNIIENTKNIFNTDGQKISAEYEKANIFYYIVYLIIFILYFVIFNKITKGQTLFKKLFGLKIVNIEKDKEISYIQYIIRMIILHKTIFMILKIIFIIFIPVDSINNYLNYLNIIQNGYDIILMVSLIMNKEGRGIHDYLSHTIVIEEKR